MNFPLQAHAGRQFCAAIATGLTLCLATALSTQAASYPEKPITLVVPFPSGGSIDAAVRAIQPRLAAELGQPVVIENLGGAGGALGAAKVASAAADGYTLLVGSNNDVVLVPVLNKNVRYQTKDFTAIGPISFNAPLLVARRDLPMNDLDGVITALRAKPESLSYGSPGMGTMQHLLMEDLQSRANVRLIHAPYKGAGPLVTDLLGGQIDLAVMVPATALPHIKAGRLKVLGVASLQREPALRNIPTLNEGKFVTGLEMSGWMGLFAPKGLAAERVARLQSALDATLATKGLDEQFRTMGMQLSTPAQRRGFVEQVGRDEARARSISVKLQ
ncbi:tripartite tricarboxylate transporter substrate binding protein [Comamonas humi]